MRKKTLVVLSVIVVASAVVPYVLLREKPRKHEKHVDTTTVSAKGFDKTEFATSMNALVNAPEAATPCETGYLAIEAEQAATKLKGSTSIFVRVAPKDEFLAACRTLPEIAQKCMMPRFRRMHDAECAQAKPPAETLKKMFETRPEPPEPELPH